MRYGAREEHRFWIDCIFPALPIYLLFGSFTFVSRDKGFVLILCLLWVIFQPTMLELFGVSQITLYLYSGRLSTVVSTWKRLVSCSLAVFRLRRAWTTSAARTGP